MRILYLHSCGDIISPSRCNYRAGSGEGTRTSIARGAIVSDVFRIQVGWPETRMPISSSSCSFIIPYTHT